jgi:exocyst complex component 4
MAAYVPPLKRSYIFGGICSISAAAFIKVSMKTLIPKP